MLGGKKFMGKVVVWTMLSLIVISGHLRAQTILVQPYLQSANTITITIKWETNTNTESVLKYGLTQDLGTGASGTSMTTLGSTILHSVTLTNLSPGTRYYYLAQTGSWQSDIFDFVTPPLRSSEQSFNIVLMSDMQKDGGHPTIFHDLINTSLLPYVASSYGSPLSDHLQIALLPGDVVDNGNSYLQFKNDFFNPAEVLWRSVPSYPAIGNHEANSQNYFNYFTLPANGTPGYLEHWYSHDYSNVRVLSFDSNNPYRIQAQLNWLDSMLELSCQDTFIDFVFAQMHHPHKSELWTPGEIDYTGQILHRMETFSDSCGKPTVHFFGHTHAYSRGQSRDHDHLWVNVATSGGNIDSWGEFPNQDYEEFIVSQDEYGFVMVEVTAGDDPQFVLKRLSFGDASDPGGSEQKDLVVIKKNNNAPNAPYPLYPTILDTVSSDCVSLKSDGFFDADGDEHGASHWQVSTDSSNFSSPVFDSWKQYANWYGDIDLQAN
ncbi:MAG: metallophosphoesterase family protein, partial [Saprospiraceae bacterium]